MSTNNIGFYEDLTKIITLLSSNIIKYAPYSSAATLALFTLIGCKGAAHFVFVVIFSSFAKYNLFVFVLLYVTDARQDLITAFHLCCSSPGITYI